MILTQHPYVDDQGISHETLIRTYTDSEGKILQQVETGFLYLEAIDVYPCAFTYIEVDIPLEEDDGEEENVEENEIGHPDSSVQGN